MRELNIKYPGHRHCLDNTRLPLLISVPHGGYRVPAELAPHISLSPRDIFPDSDPCTRTIYGFQNEVLYYHDTDIARAVIDLNRSKDDLPPNNPDGVVKSHTVMGKEVYHPNFSFSSGEINALQERYYLPYHRKIADDLNNPNVLCGLDCHSMLEFLPGVDPYKGNERPFICLSNCGNENGEESDEKITCSAEFINVLADCLKNVFPEEAHNIALNSPFKGGHISRYHSTDIPWIQVELNRRAYLQDPWFNATTLQVDINRLEDLRHKFLHAFIAFCDEAGNMQYSENYSNRYPQGKALSITSLL